MAVLQTFADVVLHATLTPPDWYYPRRKPARIVEIEALVRKHLTMASAITLGVRQISVEMALPFEMSGAQVHQAVAAARAAIREAIERWEEEDRPRREGAA